MKKYITFAFVFLLGVHLSGQQKLGFENDTIIGATLADGDLIVAANGGGTLDLRNAGVNSAVALSGDTVGFTMGWLYAEGNLANIGFQLPSSASQNAVDIQLFANEITFRTETTAGVFATRIGIDEDRIGFFTATPVVRPISTSDIKDSLVGLGLITDGGATPLNLDGGVLIVGQIGILATPTIDLAVGDSDTGLNQTADGVLNIVAQNVVAAVAQTDGANIRFFLPGVDDDAAENPVCRSSAGELSRGSAGCNVSSRRYKINIREMSYGLAEVMRLRPVMYEKRVNAVRVQFGLIAEEVAEIFPEIIAYEPDDPTLIQTYDYRGMHAVLVKAIQEQQAQIEALTAQLGRGDRLDRP